MSSVLAFITSVIAIAQLAVQIQQDVMPFLNLVMKASGTKGWQPTDADWAALDALEAPIRAALRNASVV